MEEEAQNMTVRDSLSEAFLDYVFTVSFNLQQV